MLIDEYLKKAKIPEKRAERLRAQVPAFDQAIRADLEMGSITGDEDWDRYLSYVQAIRNHYEDRRIAAISAISSPIVATVDDVMRQKSQLSMTIGAVNALDAVLQIPAMLKQDAEKAKELLTQIGIDLSAD